MRLSKAVLFVLCALLAAFPAFAQEETFATCQMPEGSEFLYITEATGFQVPQGLEDMYALMLDSNGQSDVYIARMRYGRALASISCTTGAGPGAAEDLLALWPEAAGRIAQDVSYINDSASCADVDTAFGYDALTIRTDIAVGEENMTLLEAQCAAFYNGPDLSRYGRSFRQIPLISMTSRRRQSWRATGRTLKRLLPACLFRLTRIRRKTEGSRDDGNLEHRGAVPERAGSHPSVLQRSFEGNGRDGCGV